MTTSTTPDAPTLKLEVGMQIVLPDGTRGKIESVNDVRPRTVRLGVRRDDGQLEFHQFSI